MSVDEEVLRRSLTGPGRLWRQVDWVTETGSTNADLAEAARAGAASGRVRVADHQSAGRGRFDRTWQAPPGTSVAISVLLRPGEVEVARWLWLPLATGIAVATGLRAVAGVEAELKWPNDVLIGGGKVCGILAERVDDAAIIGIGINLSLTREELPVPTATSLRLAGSDATPAAVVAGVLTELEKVWRRWADGEDLRADYQRLCGTLGRTVRVHGSPTQTTEGVAVGVDEWGRLLVRSGGLVTAFAAGDVHHLR